MDTQALKTERWSCQKYNKHFTRKFHKTVACLCRADDVEDEGINEMAEGIGVTC